MKDQLSIEKKTESMDPKKVTLHFPAKPQKISMFNLTDSETYYLDFKSKWKQESVILTIRKPCWKSPEPDKCDPAEKKTYLIVISELCLALPDQL